MLPDATAVVEVASAIAPTHLAPQRRDPTVTTSYGVGQLMRAALAHRPRRLVLALGGSSTCDGGAGMLQALGATLQGVEAPASGGTLGAARAVEVPHLEVELVALCDVAVPLLGATGAARLFAPQKGATPAQVDLLEAHLTHWARTLGPAWAELPGAGAAGGLGFALAALGARLVSGIDWILDALPFDAELARCDVVLTGEGRVDAQTLQGKVVSGVLRRARALGRPAWLVAGRIDLSPDALRELGVAAAVTLAPEGTPAEQSVSCAQDFVAGAVSRVIERWRGAVDSR